MVTYQLIISSDKLPFRRGTTLDSGKAAGLRRRALFAEHGLEGVSPGSDLEGHVSALFDLLTGAFEARITGEPS
jgi:hypothetical protein